MSSHVKPILLKEGEYTKDDIEKLKTENSIWKLHGIRDSQLAEVFEIENAHKMQRESFTKEQAEYVKQHSDVEKGNWVYYPWSGELVHMVTEDQYFALRTNRNKNLITLEDQQKLYDSTIFVAGMSVGNIIATTLAYAGIAKNIVIADFDTVETANLNRLRGGLSDIGKSKIELATQQIYAINPYANITTLPEGINAETLTRENLHKPDVLFDEIDDFATKVQMRRFAKANSIPLCMLTSLGDNVLIDIERYDTQSDTKAFNGIVAEEVLDEIVNGTISEQDKVRYATQLVGIEYVPTKALGSLVEINKTLVGRPQLANAIMLDGALATVIVKELLLGSELVSGRYYLDAQKLLGVTSTTAGSDKRSAILSILQSKRPTLK